MEATDINGVTPAQESEYQVDTTAAEQSITVIAMIRSKCKRLAINKALIPLKIAIFFWYGGCPLLVTFLPVYFVAQLGLSVYQLALINVATVPFKFLGPIVAGIIADKTGRPKPVLYANLIFVLIFVNTMLLIPKIEYEKCEGFSAEINCRTIINNTYRASDFNTTSFPIITDLDVRTCDVQCPLEGLSKSTSRPKHIHTFNGTTRLSSRAQQQFMCCIYNNISSNSSVEYNNNDTFIIKNLNVPTCENGLSCNFKCFNMIGENCDVNQSSNMTLVFVLSFVIWSLYSCVLSCCYFFMDVLCMTMVKKHDSDYGRQALWRVLSTGVLSPLCGYVIKLTARTGTIENYASVVYVFDGAALITLVTVMKLDIEINSPGIKMRKKALSLIQNSDVLIFFLLLMILGTSWYFVRSFSALYLYGFNAPSLLIGVLPGFNALVALPFLATSNWWVKKIGSSNLLLLALVAYTLHGIGYSFLVNPWHAFIYELLGIFTYHLAWVAAVRCCYELAPKGLIATTVTTAGSLFFGIGSGTGNAVGLIMGKYGGKTAFRFVASMCGVAAILFIMFRYLRRRRQNIGSDIKSEIAP